jgi:YVTN family beta-propeller protein
MLQYGNIQRRVIFLTILVSVVTSLNLTYAQQDESLHQKTLYEITKHTSSTQSPHITVGKGDDIRIGVNSNRNIIYVANSDDGTVSVIDGYNNTKIGDIKVGSGPSAIAPGPLSSDTIYVANSDDGTVSVIDGKNNTKIGDIKVGKKPSAIAPGPVLSDTIYVANSGDDTVSVINGKNNTKIGDIKVGSGPSAIAVSSLSFGPRGKIFVANSIDDTVSVIDGTTNTKIGDIKVGSGPSAIAVDNIRNTIYVANSIDDTVSVIDGYNNTKIGDIKVGSGPSDIGVYIHSPDTIYVANSDDDTVSVINGTTNTKIGDIKVGSGTGFGIYANTIDVNINTNKIYVANSGDDTVSVIDGTTNTKIGDIKVGSGPSDIGVMLRTNTIYVANSIDDTVSVIDGVANKVIAGVTFNIEPFNAGHIECDKDKLIAPIEQQFYLWPGSECIAKPNQGFEFVSWQENLGGNSTQLIKFSPPPSISDSILDFLHMKPDRPEAKLDITKFGSFTANFKALPPPIPTEYVATLFTVVATAFIGSWLTPTVIGWRKAKKEGSKLDYYHNKVKKLYNDGKLDRNDIEELNNLRDNITDEYTRGKINKEQYDKLADEISMNYGEIFTKEIDSLNNLSENEKVKQLSAIKSDIEDMHAKGKIDNEYYANLKKEISMLYEEIFKKEIDSLNNLPDNDRAKLLVKIKNDVSGAYSKENINELHYILLKEKLSNYEKK